MERDPRANESEEKTERESEVGEASQSMDGGDEDLTSALEAERARSAEFLDQAQRARAEFVNYRRRMEQEMQQVRQSASERIIQKLLPTLDDLNRAIDSMPETERDTPWAQGILLIQRKLWSTLEAEGVRPIESIGQPFDPSRHEAVSIQEGSNGASFVVDEYQRGYTLHDRVIRPAMVVVGSLESGSGDTDKSR